MHAWLKRAVAGLLSAGTLLGGGLLTAGTANADEIRMPDIGKTITSLTASAATTYPRELVNGGFDYLPAGGWNVISPKLNTSRGKFTSVDPVNGQYIRNAHVTDGNVAWVKWDGFDASKFGWISDQKGGKPQGFVTDHANSVELQRDNDTDNTYAEIVGSEIGKSIYQKIDTQNSTDAVYTVRFDHAALSSEHADGMQALVNGKPVTMTRIGGNKAGDKTGWTGTDIVTHATNTDHYRHDGQWATYEGKVTIPANTPVSTFMFKSLNEAKPDMGNLIDNLTFKIAYRLSYDSNGGTKAKASQISSMTEGKASETDGKVKTVADDAATVANTTNTLPDHLVNGDFEYPVKSDMPVNDGNFWYISQNDGSYFAKGTVLGKRYKLPEGFDKAKFAWHSTQTGDTSYPDLERADDVQVDYKADGINHYSEISAAQSGATLYQDVATVPGVMYKWSLKHASLDSSHLDKMSVIIGEPGKETAQEATRATANGHGDKLGKVGTVISTKVSNPKIPDSNKSQEGAHTGQWETYTGTYIATGTVTRFAFHSIEGYSAWDGNLLDDISFSKAYKLTYDKNASDATGKVPSNQRGKENAVEPAESKTTGNVKTVADNTSNLPDHLVNGTFDYRGNEIINENQRVYGDTTYLAIISAKTGVIGNPLHSKLDNWDSGKFGWKSNDATAGVDTVEVQRRNHTPYPTNAGNVWGEIAAAKQGKYIYQDIATTPGVVYKWSLKHASRNADQDDSMQVMIGEPGAEAVQEATRTTSNGTDKVGEKSTTITTHGTAQDGKWETYTGDYLATSTTTRFTFRSVRDSNGQGLDFTAEGNCVDDLSFDKAYKLSYDKNSSDATGSVPSNQYGKENTVQPAKSKTTGSVGLAADKTASGLTVHDLKKNDKGKVPSSSKADSTQPAAFKAPDAKVETIASRAAGDELAVNGGFDTPKWSIAKEGQGLPWIYVYSDKGVISSYYQYANGQNGTKMPGLTTSSFAWRDVDNFGGHQVMELHREKDGNTAADVHAGRTVAQTVATTPGASYTFGIRHSGRSKGHAGGVTLLAGPDKDHLTPVKLTRTTVSKTGAKYGDKTGDVGTVAYTHSDSADATEGSHDPWDHSDDWESYEGTVIIPAGQSRTMIAYRGVAKDGTLTASANDSIIDDLSFRLAYKLSYDANGGAKKSTSQIKASTDGKVKTIAGKTDSLPTELVNGSFDYPAGLIAGVSTKYPWDDWTVVDPINGRYARHIGIDKDPWAPIPGWDASKFAWKSTQTKGTDWQQIAQGVELQKDSKTGNQYAELVAGQAGTAIFQDIATIPGVSYRWTLKHASLDRNHLDGMSVMIGEPGKESAQDARRTTVNGNGDQPGDVGKVISTKVSNDAELNHSSRNHSSRNHDGQWETYTGTYIATGTVTRFTFKSVSSSNNVNGNILDDLSFTKAYRLGYDGNGGTGQVPSRTETGRTETAASGTDGTVRLAADKSAGPESGTIADDRRVLTDTTARQDDGTSQRTITRSDGSVRVETIADTGAVSGCQVYYPAGTRITLATAKADSDCWDSSQISKTNRTFYGWSANTDANDRDVPVADTMDRNTLNANVRTEIVMPARAKTVYALWAINPTLSYNVNTPAGSNAPGTPASQTAPYNTAAADKSGWAAGDTGKIPGYRFDGWYTAPNGGNKYDFNTPLTNNVTVYAHWIGNGYTVRFTGNGATGGSTPDQAFQYNIGQNLHRNGFTRDGYTFTGWKRADNQQAYGDGQWVNNLTTQPNGIVTMVAQWSANEAHIRYNPNPPAGKTAGGNGTPNWDGHTGDTPAIGGNGWTIDGYTFAGWTTNADGSGTKYAPGASWTASGTLTLYAQWTPGEAGLTYDGNGATGGKTDPQNGVTDQKVNVRQNGFTRDGYTFVRWDTQADCRGKAVNLGDKWTLQGSSTLYACWAGVAQTLTYHGNGATGGNTAAQSGKTGDELTTNANGFTRDGYTFVRWDTAKDGSGIAYGEGKNGVGRYTMKPAGNDLYAIWQANPASIRYRDDYGATGSTPDTTGVTGQNVTIAQNGFTRPGYTFTGWARDRRTDPSLQPGGRYTLTPGTTTLWAQWKADPAHLIYNSNSGSTSQTRRTDGVVDQTLTVIANPFTRSGYTFTGWNTQADGRGKAYAAGNGFRLVADAKSNPVNTTVLYAQWRINRVALKFDPNGGTGGYPDITADAFTTVTIPADAKEPKVQRPGFRFTGWAMKPTPGNGDTILGPGKGTVAMPDRGSITVYAQWAPAMTTLPFTGGHAQVPTIGLYAGLAFMILAMGALMPVIRLRMGAGSKGRHAGTPTIGRHSR
ncbi:InlB B-repeat-containing protein [Bifidobacterium longum]|uniref:InlB B-repeat-containing protein n=1 Tax=Bifidobacterium longum TaxID=216816 RepID=UPI001E59C5ED|nr:InlB B-repeat-containing protein [Bifidobacterium longum]MDB6541921.1 InlB B-repeat-containing protein [Bifidobacterium longum]MDB6546056.1 InlB B-repeat-containing protein [Bifidobacterium longum]MDB6547980.1 InlB B-repeat-containing protein [Bifidobacterium longum]MDB6550188.1 InlB B-repeat-containing protein [Bifidobacterium longum]MDB6552494.1 InlB B-repeat-containing protein [Bifidobacterium longum]